MTSSALLCLNRIFARFVLQKLTAAGRFDVRIAVFGAGPIARRVSDFLVGTKSGIRLIGVYDDRKDEDRLDTQGLSVSGRLPELMAAAGDGLVDQIIVALPPAADRRLEHIVNKLERLPVSIHVVSHIASDLIDSGPAHKVSALGPVGLIDVKAKPLSDWGPYVKRGEDLLIGGLALAVFLPVMALVALAIKLDSPGPVLFRQRRRGLNQKVFEVLKFRTMSVMEDGPSVPQATRNDPRVTSVGAFLRKSSLDELPQLFNVLKGEMSLVGPRPHALVHDEQWGAHLERYANRHQVKPGITGLAQVNGFRGEMDTPEKIKGRVDFDLKYIGEWSLGLDLKILARTVLAFFGAPNAH